MAGQQGTSTDWSDERRVAAEVRAIPGLAPGEADELTRAITRAVSNENDLAKKERLVGKIKGLVEGAAAGGVKGLFNAALSAVSGGIL